MSRARIAMKLAGLASRKIAKVTKRKTKGRKGGKVGGKTPKHQPVVGQMSTRLVVKQRTSQMSRAEQAAGRGAANAVASISLKARAFPMSVSMRNDIKIGNNAARMLKAQYAGGPRPRLNAVFNSRRNEQGRLPRINGRRVGNVPSGKNPFTGPHTKVQRDRSHSARAHGRPIPESNPMGYNPLQWKFNQGAGKKKKRFAEALNFRSQIDNFLKSRRYGQAPGGLRNE